MISFEPRQQFQRDIFTKSLCNFLPRLVHFVLFENVFEKTSLFIFCHFEHSNRKNIRKIQKEVIAVLLVCICIRKIETWNAGYTPAFFCTPSFCFGRYTKPFLLAFA